MGRAFEDMCAQARGGRGARARGAAGSRAAPSPKVLARQPCRVTPALRRARRAASGAQMYYRGKMFGFVHLYNGQEAVSTGVIKQLRKDDYVTSTYRDHVHAISKGCAPKEVMAELFGKTTGVCRGQGGSMHMFSKEWGVLGGYAFIGEGIPVRRPPAPRAPRAARARPRAAH